MKNWNVEICDVTLRDGEQTPGVCFTTEEKIEIATMIDQVGVEIIEAGFPVVSHNERETIKKISSLGLNAKICCLARALIGDVDAAIEAGADVVAVFFGTSDLHIRHKFKKPRDEVLEDALTVVDYAVDHGLTVRFSAEDATRTDTAFLKKMYARGAEHGAVYSGYADTVGYLTPMEMERAMQELLPGLNNKLCVHCHNDMGCATANTLTAAECGAFQLHTTVNGLGERAGNASLEEVLVALSLKGGVDRYDLSLVTELSDLVEARSGIKKAKTKPVVGAHAFAHESGIHIAAMIEEPETYEYVRPDLVGSKRTYILGKHTGYKALNHIVTALGYNLSADETQWILEQIKVISEGKCAVTQDVLCGLICRSRESTRP